MSLESEFLEVIMEETDPRLSLALQNPATLPSTYQFVYHAFLLRSLLSTIWTSLAEYVHLYLVKMAPETKLHLLSVQQSVSLSD